VAKVGGVPTRNSTLNDLDMVRQYPEYITLRQQLEYSDPDWRPIIPEWDEINIQALGVAVSEALDGQEDARRGAQRHGAQGERRDGARRLPEGLIRATAAPTHHTPPPCAHHAGFPWSTSAPPCW
jgi:hypothetical protein